MTEYLFGLILFLVLLGFIKGMILNFIIRFRFKREWFKNDRRYIVQRCYEEGFGYNKDGIIIQSKIEKIIDKNKNEILTDVNDEDNRNNIYLVNRKKRQFHRITDSYTLGQLGYPRPSRKADKCFKLSDGYTIKNQIKIRNIISEFNEIKKLKD